MAQERGHYLGLGLSIAIAGAVLGLPIILSAQAGGTGTKAVPTFAKDVAPIFQEKCQTCHRAGEMAPMSLVTYQEVRPWVRSIRTKVGADDMPPWFVDKTVGIQKFINDISLTPEQKDIIIRWADGGAPQGNPGDMPAAKVWPKYDGWRLANRFGNPDLVVTPNGWKVAATGPDQWWEPIADTGLKEDRWVRAIELKPSDRRVVHHAVAYLYQAEDQSVLDAEQRLLKAQGTVEEFLEAMKHPSGKLVEPTEDAPLFVEWAVGKEGEIYPDGTGKLMKANAKLGFEMHYHTVGEEVTDNTQIAIWFYPKGYVPKRVVRYTGLAAAKTLLIPPNTVTAHDGYTVLPAPAMIENFQPHMHVRGKEYTMEAILPDGRVEVLNRTRNFHFNWSVNYVYDPDVAPVLPKGTVIHIRSVQDNTSANKNNPDQRQWVTGGARTVDEMSQANTQIVYLTQQDYDEIVAERAAKTKTKTQTQNQ